MKTKLLSFLIGIACGALGMFIANRPTGDDAAGGSGEPEGTSINPDRKDKKIASLEKKVAELEALRSPAAEGAVANREAPSPDRNKTVRVFGAKDGNVEFDIHKMRREMRQQQEERDAKQVAATLASLTRTLELSADQAESVQALLEKRAANRGNGFSSLFKLATGSAEGDAVDIASAFIPGGKGEDADERFDFDAELLALLDDDQSAAYAEYKAAQNDNYVEATATRQIAQLQTSIPDLSKEQKDAAFNEFARIAREDVDTYGAPDTKPLGFDPQRMMIQRKAQKEAMKGLLTPEQFAVYDSSSISGGLTIGAPAGAAIISTQAIEIEIPTETPPPATEGE